MRHVVTRAMSEEIGLERSGLLGLSRFDVWPRVETKSLDHATQGPGYLLELHTTWHSH